MLQLENNVEFREFLEVHKSKSNKSAWANDIVLPDSKKHRHGKDKSAHESWRSNEEEDLPATEKDSTSKVEPKKKLSDLEVS